MDNEIYVRVVRTNYQAEDTVKLHFYAVGATMDIPLTLKEATRLSEDLNEQILALRYDQAQLRAAYDNGLDPERVEANGEGIPYDEEEAEYQRRHSVYQVNSSDDYSFNMVMPDKEWGTSFNNQREYDSEMYEHYARQEDGGF